MHLVWIVLKTDWIKLDPQRWVSSWTSPLNPRPCHAGWPQGKATQGKHKVSTLNDPKISRSRHYLTLNVSETVRDKAIVTTERNTDRDLHVPTKGVISTERNTDRDLHVPTKGVISNKLEWRCDFAKYSLTRNIARSLCDSGASWRQRVSIILTILATATSLSIIITSLVDIRRQRQ